ncbi:hypothetical protein [Acinetobacter populi]|uniref:Lipoprotein n=1 Tax=Acinetobacter populi TaxID=1582270 RepID=A0A1Z9YUA2_9GAMM|nr:hypothetical protein [Acinetobacter populi]OUY05794.1 hypothetical protein CAP51_16405 [Acinetobacter populi]
MKYNFLAFSIMALGLFGCATQPVQHSSLAIDQKVYQGYEQLLSKQSYAFDGKVSFNFEPTSSQAVNATKSEEYLLRQKVLQDIFAQQKFNPEQQAVLQDGLEKFNKTKSSSKKDKQFATLMKSFMDRYYYSFDGVVDLKRGQMSMNPKLGYTAKNLQAWISLPLAVDFQQYKAYADISALSPIVTDPQYDGRYVVFDFADLAKNSKLNFKPALQLAREWMLVGPALANATDYQQVKLTAQDRQQGGIERIRYVGSYENILADYYLYFYLNSDYLKTIVANKDNKLANDLGIDDLISGDQISLQKKILKATKNLDTASTLTDRAYTKQELANQAVDRLYIAIDERYYQKENSQTNNSQNQIAVTPPLGKTSNVTEAAGQAADDAAQAAADALASSNVTESSYAAIQQSETDQEKDWNDAVEEEYSSSYGKLAAQQKLREQILQKFAPYKSSELVDAKRLKQIINAQPDAYQELIKLVKDEFGTADMLKGAKYTMDMVLDQKGRLVHIDVDAGFAGLEDIGIKSVSSKMQMNIFNYGTAQVDQQQLKQAVSFKEAANQNTLLNLGEKFGKFQQSLEPKTGSATEKSTTSWSNDERYQALVEQLNAKNVNFIDAYTTVYKYAYLLDGLDLDEGEFSAPDLNKTAYWTAIYYASEKGLPYSKKQYQEYENAPEEWPYYDEYVAEKVWKVFATQQENSQLLKTFQQLNKQGKSTAEIFSQLYMQEELAKKHRYDDKAQLKPRLVEYIQALGKIAEGDLKNQKIDSDLLTPFTVVELDQLDSSIYRKIYQLFLK